MTTTDNVALLLSSLERAIRQDRRFFVAAQADPTFSPMEAEVEGLLGRLLREAKARAEQELTQAQSAFAELKAWHGETGSTNAAMAKLEAAWKTGSYYGYLDALPLAREAETSIATALQAQKTSLNNSIAGLQGQADTLRSSVARLMPEYATNRANQLATFNAAEKKYDEALGLAQIDRYAGWMQAFQLFGACIETLRPLEMNLANREREVQAEARYQERVAEAKAQHSEHLMILHIAMLFYILYMLAAVGGAVLFFYGVAAAKDDSVAFQGIWACILSPLAILVADRIWSIGKNEHGSEAQWNWLWLCLVSFVNAFIAPILAIVVYVRGMTKIKEDFTGAMDVAERLRNR